MEHTYSDYKAEFADIDGKITALLERKKLLAQIIALHESLYGLQSQRSESDIVDHSLGAELTQRYGTGAVAAALREHSAKVNAAESAQQAGTYGLAAALRDHTAKGRILAAVEEYISVDGPQTTRQLLARLEQDGIEVGGSDKMNSLSVILSKSGQYKADRINGWQSESSHKEVTPPDAGTSAGS